MKKKTKVIKTPDLCRNLVCIGVLALSAMSLTAENVFITSYYGNTATTHLTPSPHSVSTGFSTYGASSASMSTASPSPGVSPRRIIFGMSEGASWSVSPENGTFGGMNFTTLQNIGVYKIHVTKGQSGNASTNIVVNMTATGGDLADSNGVASASVPLDVFQRAKPNHVWVHVGYITNTVSNPVITFTHASGAIDNLADAVQNTGQRWYVDAVWFEFVDQCSGVAPQVGVAGPLAEAQSFVNVYNVIAGATNVTVYSGGAEIGQTNRAAGFSAGTLTVPTSQLNINQIITAKQIKGGCESILSTSGPEVGGGPNATLRAFLGLWKDSSLAGPAGANVVTNTLVENYFVKASGLIGGYGTAFTGGETLAPGECWQTVTFDPNESNFTPAGLSVSPGDPYAALSGLAFAISDADSGPYEIYVDQIMNGDVVIEDFEGAAPGTIRTFNSPNAASLPPSTTFLSGQNSSAVSQNNVFQGSNACRMTWQWVDSSNIRWVHVLANASTNSGKYYPQIDTSKPVTVRYLVLPIGTTTNRLWFPTSPISQTKAVGGSVTFTVQPGGVGPFSYQWQFAGADITGATTSTYTKSNLQLTDAGVYSVAVTTPSCSATSSAALTVTESVQPPTLAFTRSGSQMTLNWTGSFTLQSCNVLGAGWNDVTSASGYSQSLTSTNAVYFRLRQ